MSRSAEEAYADWVLKQVAWYEERRAEDSEVTVVTEREARRGVKVA